MATSLEIAFHNKRQHRQIPLDRELDLGSAPPTTATPVTIDDPELIAWQLRIWPDTNDANAVHLLNIADPLSIGDDICEQGEELTVQLPIEFKIGETHLTIFDSAYQRDWIDAIQCLPESRGTAGELHVTLDHLGKPPAAETLNRWFQALGSLQRKAASSHEFFDDAATAVVTPGGLETGMILLQEDCQWKIISSHRSNSGIGMTYQTAFLDEMVLLRSTVYHAASDANDVVESLVASPIFNEQSEIVGAVYGSRSLRSANQRRGIRPLEAQWIQLVAECISGGLTRMAKEAEAARTRVLLEQVFSRTVVNELERNSAILKGQERIVTVMFADLRGFSAISENISTQQTFDFLSDVMDNLTDTVMNLGGVIIDYYGDGLSAMWNAPLQQPDDATLACRAALKMNSQIQQLEKEWRAKLGISVQMGFGIHTGLARVGNAGSERRLKYGPRGSTVNLAARLETATKRFGGGILISQETKQRLSENAQYEILPPLELKGFAQPVQAYRLISLRDQEIPTHDPSPTENAE